MPGILSDRRGVTLPLVIIVTGLLMMGALAGLARVSVERRTTANLDGEVSGFALAQAGLSRYMAAVTAPPPAILDTVITGLPGGIDSISVRLIRAAGGGLAALYVIRSSSVGTGVRRYDTRTPPARRSSVQFALWRPGSMEIGGAWTSLTGLQKHGGAGTISGADQCGVNAPVAGVTVPVTGATGGPGYDQNGGSPVPTGSPPVAYPAATPAAMAAQLDIDWDGIVNGGAITPDYLLTGSAGWPPTFPGWPIVLVRTTSLSLGPGNSGRGLLIVTGDLRLNGSFSWDGIILVGGTIQSNGNNTVDGAVMSGLNVALGQSVGVSDVGNGTKTFRYNSCNVDQALSNLGSLQALPNAWADNWPVY